MQTAPLPDNTSNILSTRALRKELPELSHISCVSCDTYHVSVCPSWKMMLQPQLPHFSLVCCLPRACTDRNGSLQSPPRSPTSTHPTMPTDHIPRCHISTVPKHLQGWGLHHSLGILCQHLTSLSEKEFFLVSNLRMLSLF